MRRLVPLLATLAVAVAAAPHALADGDPASDYLISQPVFLPLSDEVGDERAKELRAVLDAAKASGYEIRAAIIRTPYDLGAVPVLFKKPQRYATFLGQELYYWYKGPLLIVMPNGYGIYKNGPAPAGDKALVERLPPPGTSSPDALAAAATRAVQALAGRRGIDLSDAKPVERSSSNRDRVMLSIGTAVAAALAGGFLFFRRRRARLG